MSNPVATVTRAARIACLSSEAIARHIDDILDLRNGGTSSEWTDPELADLWAELRKRQMAGARSAPA